MRLNQYIALHTGISRRKADELIKRGKVVINDSPVSLGYEVKDNDKVLINGKPIKPGTQKVVVILNKPAGYVVSREGQGSKTIYDLLPQDLYNLKPVGRLDKDSSGLLLLTNDGKLANKLTHPKYQKKKIYEVELDKPLSPRDKTRIEKGILLEDGTSKLELKGDKKNWEVEMHEGRNRQIRRTFAALDYKVIHLHRSHFGNYSLDKLPSAKWKNIV